MDHEDVLLGDEGDCGSLLLPCPPRHFRSWRRMLLDALNPRPHLGQENAVQTNEDTSGSPGPSERYANN